MPAHPALRHSGGNGDHWIRGHVRRGGALPEMADPGLADRGVMPKGRVWVRGDTTPGLPPSPGPSRRSTERPHPVGCGRSESGPDLVRIWSGSGQARPLVVRKSLATVSASFLSTTTCLSRSDRVAVSSLAETALRAPSMVGLLLLLVISGTTF